MSQISSIWPIIWPDTINRFVVDTNGYKMGDWGIREKRLEYINYGNLINISHKSLYGIDSGRVTFIYCVGYRGGDYHGCQGLEPSMLGFSTFDDKSQDYPALLLKWDWNFHQKVI